MLNLVF